MKLASLVVALVLPAAALAQHSHYAGQQSRELKALSAEEVKQYLSGAGMGYAKPAELNLFPGPMHVLEHAGALGLSDAQRAATKQLMDEHKAEARAIGARVVEAERDLEALFRAGSVDEDRLKTAVQRAGFLQAEYRLSHLETHRRMRALLTDKQVIEYHHARGYGAPAAQSGHKH